MNKYRCTFCGYIYDSSVGDVDAAIKAGTTFEELPEDWTCPVCRIEKSHFEEVDESNYDELKTADSAETSRNRKIDEENIAPQNESRIEEINNEDNYDNNSSCDCYDELDVPIEDK